MERRANDGIVDSDSEFAFCVRCGRFVYTDLTDACFCCGRRDTITYRRLPIFESQRTRLWKGRVLALGIIGVTAFFCWLILR